MKKYFWIIAAAAIAFAACKKTPTIPIDPVDPDGPQDGYVEKTVKVNVEIMKDIETSGWAAHAAEMPGEQILDFFDMTAEEFYVAMGYCPDDAGSTGISTQLDNTIMFGVANENDTDNLSWIPKTSANYGHWWSKTGRMTYWYDEVGDKYFYTESVIEWGLESPDTETLDAMWTYNIGFLDGGFDGNIGDVYKATEVFFLTDDEDVERYFYVEWNIKIIAPEEVTITKKGEQEIVIDSEFIPDHGHTSLVPEIDAAALESAIGVSLDDAIAYGVNADGSYTLASGWNFWFTIEGNVGGWGEGAGICINNDATGEWAWCMYYNADTVAGQTCKGAVAFVNPDTYDAYVVKLTVNVSELEEADFAVEGEQDLTYDVTFDDEYIAHPFISAIDAEALAAAIGISLEDASVYGVNADGSYTATAGTDFWYSVEGDIVGWSAEAGQNGIGINANHEEGWNWCMYPDTNLKGQTCKGSIAFVNAETKVAYVVNVIVNIAE